MVYIHEPVFVPKMHSRIVADSREELEEFGEMLGLNLGWIQQLGSVPHFIVYSTKLKLALTHSGVQYLTLAEFEKYLTSTDTHD